MGNDGGKPMQPLELHGSRRLLGARSRQTRAGGARQWL